MRGSGLRRRPPGWKPSLHLVMGVRRAIAEMFGRDYRDLQHWCSTPGAGCREGRICGAPPGIAGGVGARGATRVGDTSTASRRGTERAGTGAAGRERRWRRPCLGCNKRVLGVRGSASSGGGGGGGDGAEGGEEEEAAVRREESSGGG